MATIRSRRDVIEVNYLTKVVDTKGKTIKGNIKAKSIIHLSDVSIVDYFYDSKGNRDLNKCRIFHNEMEWMVLNEKYEEMYNHKLDGTFQIVGFKQKVKKGKHGKSIGK